MVTVTNTLDWSVAPEEFSKNRRECPKCKGFGYLVEIKGDRNITSVEDYSVDCTYGTKLL
jgi:hypothetical protein